MLEAAVFALGSVSILMPFFGSKGATATLSTSCTSAASSLTPAAGRAIPESSALRFAMARMSVMCEASEVENMTGRGKRFGALQKGEPVDVTASSGNVNVSCKILSWNCSWNCVRAQAMHSSYVEHAVFNNTCATFSTFSRAEASGFDSAAAAYSSGLDK